MNLKEDLKMIYSNTSSKISFMKFPAVSRLSRLLVGIALGVGFVFNPLYAGAQDEFDGEEIVEGPLMDDRAPNIELNTLDGEKFQLSQWIGKKPFVLVFYVTWCKTCKGEIPTIKKIHATYAGEKLGLITVNAHFKDSLDNAHLYRKEHKLPYKILFDKAGKAADKYMVLGVPMILMVDKSGIIRYRASRFPAELDKAVKYIMQ